MSGAQRIAERDENDKRILEEAKGNGFMDCMAVRDALGYDQPKADGSYYSSMEVTYNFALLKRW